MTLLIQKNQPDTDFAGRDNETLTDAWVDVDFELSRGESEISLNSTLPWAAKRAEQLMDALEDELSVPVSISYIRVETRTSFHVLILLDREDFLSSKMQDVRLVAQRFAQISSSYSIHFAFAIETENMMQNIIKFNGYRLLHLR